MWFVWVEILVDKTYLVLDLMSACVGPGFCPVGKPRILRMGRQQHGSLPNLLLAVVAGCTTTTTTAPSCATVQFIQDSIALYAHNLPVSSTAPVRPSPLTPPAGITTAVHVTVPTAENVRIVPRTLDSFGTSRRSRCCDDGNIIVHTTTAGGG